MAAITAGAAAAGAGISAGAGLIGNILNWFNVHHTNESNERIAELNRQFQHDEAILGRQWEEQMANTAYQRSLADMKAAGLNPNLLAPSSAQVGSTSTPQGSTATMQAPHIETGSITSAINAYTSLKQVSLLEKMLEKDSSSAFGRAEYNKVKKAWDNYWDKKDDTGGFTIL